MITSLTIKLHTHFTQYKTHKDAYGSKECDIKSEKYSNTIVKQTAMIQNFRKISHLPCLLGLFLNGIALSLFGFWDNFSLCPI